LVKILIGGSRHNFQHCNPTNRTRFILPKYEFYERLKMFHDSSVWWHPIRTDCRCVIIKRKICKVLWPSFVRWCNSLHSAVASNANIGHVITPIQRDITVVYGRSSQPHHPAIPAAVVLADGRF
jgi:hypothetical protein